MRRYTESRRHTAWHRFQLDKHVQDVDSSMIELPMVVRAGDAEQSETFEANVSPGSLKTLQEAGNVFVDGVNGQGVMLNQMLGRNG